MKTYNEIRDTIVNGDMLFFRKGNKLTSKIIELFTKGPYCHTAIAFKMILPGTDEIRVFIVEEHAGGQRITNLSSCSSKYEGFTIIKNPVRWVDYGPKLLLKSGEVEYGYADLANIELRESLGLKLPDQPGEVCSEMVAKVLIANGIKLDTSLVSPNKLYKQLINMNFESIDVTFK